MAELSEAEAALEVAFPDAKKDELTVAFTKIKALFPLANFESSQERYKAIIEAIEVKDERLMLITSGLQPELKITEEEGFLIAPEDSEAFIEFVAWATQQGQLDPDVEYTLTDFKDIIKPAFVLFEKGYKEAVAKAFNEGGVPPSRIEYGNSTVAEAAIPDTKQIGDIVSEILNQSSLPDDERQKLFAKLMGAEGGIAASGATSEEDIRAFVTRHVSAAASAFSEKQSPLEAEAAFIEQLQGYLNDSALSQEAKGAAYTEALRQYKNAVTLDQPISAFQLISDVITQSGVQTLTEQDVATLTAQKAAAGAPTSQFQQTQLGIPELPPTAPTIPGLPSQDVADNTQAFAGIGQLVAPGSQAEAALQGLTVEQLQAQQANLAEGNLFGTELSKFLRGDGGAPLEAGFANFLAGKQGMLAQEFQAAEKTKAEQLASNFAAQGALSAQAGVAQPFVGAGDFAPGTFSDFLKTRTPDLQQEFDTEQVTQRRKRRRQAAVGGTVRVIN